ncbi:1,2-phenylacetyl-CoA epoxidase subunit PaaC [Nocardioides pyridinolyticus]
MNAAHHDHDADHQSVYDGLTGGDESQWAFGTGHEFELSEDPLAGASKTPVPAGTDAAALARYCLMLGDDALVHSHRLSEWTSNAPDLEDDIALANIALDLLGQARLLLARAAAADPSVVPALPGGSPVPPEDALAFFRDASQFRNVRLVEAVNGDFAGTIARLLLASTYRLALLERLTGSPDPVLSAIAAKGVKEVTYHRDYAGRWFLTLARGTRESRRRLDAGLVVVWPWYDELFRTHPDERAVGVDPTTVADEVSAVLDRVFSLSGVDRPEVAQAGPVAGGVGRDGRHTEVLSRLLAEMQSVARAHPLGQW